jgi:hypothetical protein
VYHHVPDHLAGDPSRCGPPADNLQVMAVQGEGNPHDLAIPAGELQRVGTPSSLERLVMIAPSWARGMRRPAGATSKASDGDVRRAPIDSRKNAVGVESLTKVRKALGRM